MTAVLYYRWLAAGLHDKIISQGVGDHKVYVAEISSTLITMMNDELGKSSLAIVIHGQGRLS